MSAKPGDVAFVTQHDFTAWWIQWCQARKYGKGSPATRWNHAFLVVGTDGSIIQANQSGVEWGNLSQYKGQTYELRRPSYVGIGAGIATIAMRDLLGDKYGWVTIASVALSMLSGTKLRFGLSGTEICSGAVAYALTRANIDMGPDCEFSTPADLYSVAIQQGWAKC
jgi:hypothetical protein